MVLSLALAAALWAAEPAAPPPPPPHPSTLPARARPPVVTPPSWRRAPTHDEIDRLYPNLARVVGLEGSVTLQCEVLLSGALSGCVIERETPTMFGFGAAALKIAPLVSMTPGRIDGVPVDRALVRVPFLFTPPLTGLPDLDGSLRCYGRLSAFVRGHPLDARGAAAAELARRRSDALMTSAGLSSDERTDRLSAAVDASPDAEQGSKITNVCFKSFLE